MTNLKKFYPGKRLEDFRADKWCYVRDPDSSKDNPHTIACSACPAKEYCDANPEYETCVDTFEAWLRQPVDYNETNTAMILKELKLAEQKHPKFCDLLTGATQKQIALYEHRIKKINSNPPYYGEFILNEEIAEAMNAYLKGEKEHAMQELAQCGAVILRMMEFVQNEINGGKK